MYFIACILGVASVLAAPTEDVMTSLPDTAPFDSPTYSGYLNISEYKSLHYVFTESLNNATTDPIVIWFNGGPGCSSMLGFMQENGPRVIDDGETEVKTNPYPWNMRANVMWLESPAGVGFSIDTDPAGQSSNDTISSTDALAALLVWYEKFPEFKPNQLFVSGESYAGIYVPYLAYQIYENNLAAVNNTALWHINLNGTMVGNGCTDWTYDNNDGDTATFANFNIIPHHIWKDWQADGCHSYYSGFPNNTMPAKCKTLEAKIQQLTFHLNIYDLYRPVYGGGLLKGEKQERYGTTWIDGEERTYKRGFTMRDYTPWNSFHNRSKSINEEEALLGDYVSDYLNMNTTRTALNIPSTVGVWNECSNNLDYTWQANGSYWIYNTINTTTRMLFYSGDTDGAVPTYGSKGWIQSLNRTVTDPWRPWYTDEQVSGYVEKYDGLEFVTVKGVGHMAPQWARQPVTEMITAWIHNEPF